MSKYLYQKFYGKYRILVPIDRNTNDFPRDMEGRIETEDFYIPCKYGEISHYSRDILEAWVTSITKFNKMLKIANEKDIAIVKSVEMDGEGSIYFRAKDIEFFAQEMKAQIMGKNVRPFSTKNLPKSDYHIPPSDLEEYKKTIARIDKSQTLELAKLTREFIDKKVAKSKRIKDIDKDIRLHKMSRQLKEYIHFNDMWNEYITYLKKNLTK